MSGSDGERRVGREVSASCTVLQPSTHAVSSRISFTSVVCVCVTDSEWRRVRERGNGGSRLHVNECGTMTAGSDNKDSRMTMNKLTAGDARLEIRVIFEFILIYFLFSCSPLFLSFSHIECTCRHTSHDMSGGCVSIVC